MPPRANRRSLPTWKEIPTRVDCATQLLSHVIFWMATQRVELGTELLIGCLVDGARFEALR